MFKLATEKDTLTTKTYYMKVKSNFAMDLPIRIATLKPLLERYHQDDLGYGIYFGIMLVMALYNLFVFSTIRDKTYLYYVCYVLSITTLYATYKGYSFEFVWKNYEGINFYFPTLVAISCFFMVVFTSSFLRTSFYTPRIHKGFYLLGTLCVALSILNISGNYALSSSLGQLASLFIVLYCLAAAIINAYYKNRAARYYLVAWSVYVFMIVVLFLQLSSIIPSNAFTKNAPFIGSAVEVILLSFALADKINVLKREKEKAQEEVLRQMKENSTLIQEQNQLLEEKVEERTHELQQSKNEIETSYESNKMLAEIGYQITSTLDLSLILDTIYENIAKLMPTDVFGIGLYDSQTQQIHYQLAIESGIRYKPYSRNMTNKNQFPVWCIEHKQEVFINDVDREYKNYLTENKNEEGSNDKLEDGSIAQKPFSLIYLPLLIQQNVLGIITVQCFESHAYTTWHKSILKTLGIYVASALENANAYKKIDTQKLLVENQHKDILASITVAKRIQDGMLPSLAKIAKSLDNFFILYKPRDIVSGDFYWLLELSSDKLQNHYHHLIVLADCTGHGVPAAFMSMIGYNLLTEITKSIHSPEKILDELQIRLTASLSQDENKNQEGMDCVAISLEKNSSTHMLRYAGAMNPLYYVQGDNFFEIKADKTAIGGEKTIEKHYTLHEVPIHSPTTIYLCTDGYQDQFSGINNKKFMVKRLREFLHEISTLPMSEQYHQLATTFDAWKGDKEQVDDVSIMGIHV